MSSIYDNYPAVRYVDEYDKDTDEQCVMCKGNCGFIGITGMWACKGFVPMTNSDRIRSMTDEELADFHAGMGCPPGIDVYEKCHDIGAVPPVCLKCWLEWLKSPVEEVDNGQTD